MENNFFIVCNDVFTYILVSHNMMNTYSHVWNSALFFMQYSGILHLHRGSLDAFYVIHMSTT